MRMTKEEQAYYAKYPTAQSPRPAWVTTLIVALVLAIAGIVLFVLGTVQGAALVGVGMLICLAIAGIQALTRVKK